MNLSFKESDDILIIRLSGRLDATCAEEVREKFNMQLNLGHNRLVLDMEEVDYLSSAGIRVLLTLWKRIDKLKGKVKLACVQSYPLSVLKISGFLTIFSMYKTIREAIESFTKTNGPKEEISQVVETFQTPEAVFKFIKHNDKSSRIRVTGNNLDFLYARCSRDSIVSESISNIKYSLGIGAMGEKEDDYFNRLGELMFVGGTVVWVPTDGHNIPDFLIPMGEVEEVKVHTTFNIVLDGTFNEIVRFEASDLKKGISLKTLYHELFKLSRSRIPEFRGLLGLVMRADVEAIFGVGIKQAPIIENTPKNRESITHRANIKDWLNFQIEPEYENTSALVVGIGLDLNSNFDSSQLQTIFYIDPKASRSQLLHNHAAIFEFLPESISNYKLEDEINTVISSSEFIGMEHLLDRSTFKKGILGLSYIQEIIHK